MWAVFYFPQRSLHVLVIFIVKHRHKASSAHPQHPEAYFWIAPVYKSENNETITYIWVTRMRALQTPLNKKIFFIAPTIQANPKSSTIWYIYLAAVGCLAMKPTQVECNALNWAFITLLSGWKCCNTRFVSSPNQFANVRRFFALLGTKGEDWAFGVGGKKAHC